MKKILYFGLSICACVAMCFCTMFFSSVKAEEEPSTLISVEKESDFFDLFKGEIGAGQKIVLANDIILTTENDLKNRNLSGVEFDGNGHTIVTSFPLFNTVGEGAVIKNLNVIASKNFVYEVENPAISNFGLVACDVKGGSVFNVSASCELISKHATDDEKKNNTYGVLDLTFKGYANVGGMFGQLRNGAVVQNCYVQTELKVTQNDPNASSTIIGGFVGSVDNAFITNCYAVPVYQKLVDDVKYINEQIGYLSITIGGFAGEIKDNLQCCANVFTGGSLPIADTQAKRYVGKVFGKVSEKVTNEKQDALKISKCCSYYQSPDIGLCGIKSDKSNIDVVEILEKDITSLDKFDASRFSDQEYFWDMDYEWDVDDVWCKKSPAMDEEKTFGEWDAVKKWQNNEYKFPVLQIFESFSITLTSSISSLGAEVSLVDENGKTLTEKNFLYGTTVYIKIDITEDYLAYKRIEALKFKGVTCELENNIENEISALVPIVITQGTSGAYEVATKDIVYYLNVRSQNVAMGTVGHNQNTTLAQDHLSEISLDRDLEFTANLKSNSFAFEKWVWLDENGQEFVGGDVVTGVVSEDEEENHLAQKVMKVKFGDKNYTDPKCVHLFMEFDEGNLVANNNIPFKEEDGKKIFTIQAKFSPNIEILNVFVNAPKDACQVFISEVLCEGNVDDGTIFSYDATVDVPVSVRIELDGGYKFVCWACDEYNINDLIDKNSNAKSKEIYLRVMDRDASKPPLEIRAVVEKIEEKKIDLTWLWWTLGGLGGAGIITLIICIAVAKRKNESFMRYY